MIDMYLEDYMYLPYWKGAENITMPHWKGRGNHSVSQLEEIIEGFVEYTYWQQIIKQNIKRHIVELKFNVKLDSDAEVDHLDTIIKLKKGE